MLKDAVLRTGAKQDKYIVELALHPAATPIVLTVTPDAELVVRGDTASIGPGYHAHVLATLAPVLDEIDYVWTDEQAPVQPAMCAWLASELRAAPTYRFGIPSTRRFRGDAPILTPLGPRDAAWRDAVLADPVHARDAFAWWDDAPGAEPLSRALLAMSFEVPWREPLDGDERELMTKVDEDLRAARKANPSLALPYAEWKELLFHLGIADEDVDAKASGTPLLGYRRLDLDVDLSGDWRVAIPGAMVGHWEDDGERYWATDGDRAIEFTSLTAKDESDSATLLAVAPERYPVVDRIAETDRVGRAEAYEDEGTPIVIGLMCSAPHVGIITCKGGTRDWALDTWRSLRQVEE